MFFCFFSWSPCYEDPRHSVLVLQGSVRSRTPNRTWSGGWNGRCKFHEKSIWLNVTCTWGFRNIFFCVITWNKHLTLSFDIIQFFGGHENVYAYLLNAPCWQMVWQNSMANCDECSWSLSFFLKVNLILHNVSFANGLFISVVCMAKHLWEVKPKTLHISRIQLGKTQKKKGEKQNNLDLFVWTLWHLWWTEEPQIL